MFVGLRLILGIAEDNYLIGGNRSSNSYQSCSYSMQGDAGVNGCFQKKLKCLHRPSVRRKVRSGRGGALHHRGQRGVVHEFGDIVADIEKDPAELAHGFLAEAEAKTV